MVSPCVPVQVPKAEEPAALSGPDVGYTALCGRSVQRHHPVSLKLEPVTDLLLWSGLPGDFSNGLFPGEVSTLTLTLGSPLRTRLCWWEKWTEFGSSAPPLRSSCRRFPWSVRTSSRLLLWLQELCCWRPTVSTRYTSADVEPPFLMPQVLAGLMSGFWSRRSPVRRPTST